jgi:hypothetical protein
MTADLPGKMRGSGLRMLCTVAIQQIQKMRHILLAIPPDSDFRFLDRQKRDRTRTVRHRKWSSVQLVGQCVSQWMVLNRCHLGLRLIRRTIRHNFPTSIIFLFHTLT